MGTSLVKRDLTKRSTKTVVPRVLKQKGQITFLDHMWVYWDVYTATFFVLWFIGLSVVSIVEKDFKLIEFFVSLVFGLIFCGVVAERLESRSDERKYWYRKQQCLYERNRKLAPHRDQRAKRYQDVKYTQYSVWADREGQDLVFTILGHEPGWTYLRFRHTKKTKKGYAGGHESMAGVRLTQPKLVDVQDAIIKLDEQAELLEKQSYEQGCEKRELDRLVLLSRRPESSEKVIERHYLDEVERENARALARDYQVTE